jgi:3-hydroxyacyl-[acyl-carrier-protein] dehydratase
MRWIWIDKFTEFTSRTSATAIKNVSLAEEHLHDLYPAFPIVPHSLIVEGMAQTAGILVGEARQFKEKVILAKIGKATFHRLVRPGETIAFQATIEQLNEQGASIRGKVTLETRRDADPRGCAAAANLSPSTEDLVAEIELMFSHIDQNLAGLEFPEHNFVFTEQFTELLRTYHLSDAVQL